MRNGEVSYWWQARGGFPARRPSLPGPLEADRLESAPDGSGSAQVRAGEVLGRVGDKISGIPH